MDFVKKGAISTCRLFRWKLIALGIFIAPLSLIAATSSAQNTDPIDLVKNGTAQGIIVIPDQTKECSEADLLAEYLQKSSGAQFKINHESEVTPEQGLQIHLGLTQYVQSRKLGIDLLDGDGFIIDSMDAGRNRIIIAGNTSWGTEFGVCEFLERYLGVRWLLPGPDGEDVPTHSSLSIPCEQVKQQPAFVSRLMSGNFGPLQENWQRRNRMHGRVEFHHNLNAIFPPAIYTKTHPEFYPFVDGRRFLPPDNQYVSWQSVLLHRASSMKQ